MAKRKIDWIKSDIKDLIADLCEAYEAKIIDAESSASSVQDELDEAEGKIEELDESITEMQDDISSLNEQIVDLQKEISLLKMRPETIL